jgi:hypothetical protein
MTVIGVPVTWLPEGLMVTDETENAETVGTTAINNKKTARKILNR